ncbi:helix-turn-helix domain-containing protein [Aquirufa sp. ROCK-SH2]
MYDYVPYLSFLTSGIGFLFILYLLIQFNRYPKNYWLIGVVFGVVYMEFYIYGLTSKHIYQMLFLFRSSNIIRAFLPIFLFFYVRGMLFPQKEIRWRDALHFVFPIAVIIGIMPDLLLSDAEKTLILDNYYRHNEFLLMRKAGMIPPAILQPVSIAVGLSYSTISLGLVYFAQKIYGKSFVYFNQQTLLWLKLISLVIFLYFGLQLYQYLNLFMNHTFNPPSQIAKCVVAILLFSYFITTPNVKENMDGCIFPPEKDDVESLPNLEEIFPNLLPEFEKNDLAKHLTDSIVESKCYISENCDLISLSKMVDIPPQKLSVQIKKFYGISFTEYINRLKIHYFLTHYKQLDQYTLETYIYQSGFKNRSTFYAAFKKYVGVNPSFYMKRGM